MVVGSIPTRVTNKKITLILRGIFLLNYLKRNIHSIIRWCNFKYTVGKFPELALFAGTFRGKSFRTCFLMQTIKWEMTIDPAHVVAIGRHNLLHSRMKTFAKRTLKIRIFN